MDRSAFRLSVCASAVAVVAMVAAPTAGARAFKTTYAPKAWGASKSHSGLCLESLTCPSVSTSTAPTKQGTAMHASLGALLGVGASTSATWTSGAFTYSGAQGKLAKKVKLVVIRKADTGDLLSVAGNSATYSIGIVNTKTGSTVAEPVHSAALTPSSAYSKVGPVKVAPNVLRRGNHYRLRITATFNNGAEVIPGATADFANARVVAKKHISRNH